MVNSNLIVTSADNKRELAKIFCCSYELVRHALRFRRGSVKEMRIRNYAMNHMKSFFV